MLEKIKAWVTKRWQIVTAFFGLVIASIMFYARSKSQKKILDQANKSHKKELDVNSEAEEKLVSGLVDIAKKNQEEIKEVTDKHEEKQRDLTKAKKDFVDKAEKDEDLAKKLADKIGADFVKGD